MFSIFKFQIYILINLTMALYEIINLSTVQNPFAGWEINLILLCHNSPFQFSEIFPLPKKKSFIKQFNSSTTFKMEKKRKGKQYEIYPKFKRNQEEELFGFKN